MRIIVIGAALLAAVGILGSPSLAQGQEGSHLDVAPFRGPDRGEASATQGCGDWGRPACSNYSYGGLLGRYPACSSPYASYGGPPYGNWTYTRYSNSQSSPYFAAGGEAYSYAGYGDFNSLGYGAGTNSPTGAYGTTAFGACS